MIAVLQFDSPGRPLLRELLDAGRLPALAALAARGRTLDLETPASRLPAAAYQSLYRGIEVGDHGLFYPFQWSAGEQRIRLAHHFAAPPPVWERLAGAGVASLVLDPYESHPPRSRAARAALEASGSVVAAGVGARERVVMRPWSVPAGRRVRRGRRADVTETFGPHSERELDALARRLVAAPGRVADIAAGTLAEREFDVAWITFAAPHLAGHRLWHRPEALAAVYEATDAALGRVLAALPTGADVIACSVLGMGPDTSRADLLPDMLGAILGGGARNGNGDTDPSSIWRLRGAMPASLRRRAAAAIPDRAALALTARLELRGLDWSSVAAFAHPADNQGYVRLNLRGREAAGTVEPERAEGLCEEISVGLKSFLDPGGEAAVLSVERCAATEGGAAAVRLPDLVVRWRPSPYSGALVSPAFGEVARHGAGSGRSGNHTDGDAWAVVAPGASRGGERSGTASVTDVAATVAAVSGAPLEGLAGQPLLQR